MSERLRLRAVDAEDLTVISALLQDALVPLSDMVFIQEESRFVLALNRFRWDHPEELSRTHALLSFRGVTEVHTRGIDRRDRDRVLSVLSVREIEGSVAVEFAQSGTLRLKVAELDCVLEDVGEPWPTNFRPAHRTE